MNRQTAPEIQIIKSLMTGFPETKDNLYEIYSEEGVFKLEIVFPGSGYGLLQEKFAGIFAMDLLLSGTIEKDAHQIADEMDELGGFVFKSCDYYTSSITLYGLNENLPKILEIVKNLIDSCVFPLDELKIYKSKKISELNINLNKTNFLANRRIHQMIFGELHPFSLPITERRIQEIEQNHLADFRKNKLVNPYFIFTGSKESPIRSILIDCGFQIGPIKESVYSEPIPQNIELNLLVQKPGTSQNSIRLGKLLPARNHKDFFKINLLNLILGGYFGSRLMKNIREEKGLTYGIHSSITPFKSFSLFKISSECNNLLTHKVKTEIEKEIRELQVSLITDEELNTAKNYLSGALLRNFDGAYNISERFKAFLELDTEKNYYQKYFESINKITSEDLRTCANNYLDIKTLKYCVAGEL